MRFIEFLIQNRAELLSLTREHIEIVGISIIIAVLIGVPTGILLTRRPSLSKPIIGFANVVQTIPSLAIFGFLIPISFIGIGVKPAIIALVLYSLLPIIRNTYIGINGIDPAVREAGRGMGMTDWQLLTQVELPLAFGVILAGVRVATVIAVGVATIAAAVGGGGLGMFILRGVQNLDNNLILAGAIPAALLALVADFGLGWLEHSLIPGEKRRTPLLTKAAVAFVSLVLIALVVFSFARTSNTSPGKPIVVGSKNFTESIILGEILAQEIAKAGLPVEHRSNLGGTSICHQALVAGQIDAYVEYTGTAFTSVLKHQVISDPAEVYREVKGDYAKQFNVTVAPSLGFNDTFAMIIRSEDAQRYGLKTLSQAATYTPQWRAGFGYEFRDRPDGLPALIRTYNLRFAEEPRIMDLAITYQALKNHQVDIIAGNSTDGLISVLNLVVLEDDKHAFPPYEAVPLVRTSTLNNYQKLNDVLSLLAGKITEDDMRRLNYAVDGEHRQIKDVVKEFLTAKGL
ncbi:MAG TPA: glycine betaine ABC transporter substrate-binding protein [Blastocatellia bacterium]|nr:glycine betaine ABC transporter substrate-binding protein [Blastocatellia bacterium]